MSLTDPPPRTAPTHLATCHCTAALRGSVLPDLPPLNSYRTSPFLHAVTRRARNEAAPRRAVTRPATKTASARISSSQTHIEPRLPSKAPVRRSEWTTARSTSIAAGGTGDVLYGATAWLVHQCTTCPSSLDDCQAPIRSIRPAFSPLALTAPSSSTAPTHLATCHCTAALRGQCYPTYRPSIRTGPPLPSRANPTSPERSGVSPRSDGARPVSLTDPPPQTAPTHPKTCKCPDVRPADQSRTAEWAPGVKRRQLCGQVQAG